MKAAEARRVAQEHVLPMLGSEAVLVRRLLVLTPVEWLVRAFALGSSTSSRTDFFVHALVDPLYSPDDQAAGMAQTRSPRLIYEDGLDAGEAVTLRTWLESEGVPLVERVRSPGDLADDIERRQRGRPYDPLKEETRAYSLVLAARDLEARGVLQRIVDTYRRPNDLRDFEQEAVDRAGAMLERLDADRNGVLDVMREWRREKAPRVGVGDLLVSVAP
jgi:hypothetical protein